MAVRSNLSPHNPLYHVLSQLGRPPIDTLVHVGAHRGQELPYYEDLNPRRVVWVEGDPALMPELNRRVTEDTRGGVEHIVVQALVADRDGASARLRRFSNDGQSSSFFAATGLMTELYGNIQETGEVVEASTARLPTILRALNVAQEDVTALVLDVQGAELLCLHGIGEELRTISFIEIEVSSEPIYEGAPLFEQIDEWLRRMDFRPITPVPTHGDVVYFNKRFLAQPD